MQNTSGCKERWRKAACAGQKRSI